MRNKQWQKQTPPYVTTDARTNKNGNTGIRLQTVNKKLLVLLTRDFVLNSDAVPNYKRMFGLHWGASTSSIKHQSESHKTINTIKVYLGQNIKRFFALSSVGGITFENCTTNLALLLLNTTCPVLTNSVDADQLVSEETNWSGSALFVIKFVNFYQKSGSSNLIGWNYKWAWHLNLFSKARVSISIFFYPWSKNSNQTKYSDQVRRQWLIRPISRLYDKVTHQFTFIQGVFPRDCCNQYTQLIPVLGLFFQIHMKNTAFYVDLDKVFCFQPKSRSFSYFSIKTYIAVLIRSPSPRRV